MYSLKDKAGYQVKCKNFREKNARVAFHSKTPMDQLPFITTYCSSSHDPEDESTTVETADLVCWVKFLDTWFRPYGGFSSNQIREFIDICENDLQIEALMVLLSSREG